MIHISRIFLDLDDVCNAFTMYALHKIGCYCEPFDFEKFDPAWGFDIVKAANGMQPVIKRKLKFTRKSFWSCMDRDVWAHAPESKEFKWLLKKCLTLAGKRNIYLLTVPTEDPDCLAGKLEWIHAHCPRWLHRQYLMGSQKHLLANPNSLLIDDSDENTREFDAHGGQTILVPRPWNMLHRVDTMQELKDRFADLGY